MKNKTLNDSCNQLLYLNYTGVVNLTSTEQAVFAGTAPEGSTPFGNICEYITGLSMAEPSLIVALVTHFTFEARLHPIPTPQNKPMLTQIQTGDERYKDLENRVFVGQGRFNIESGKPVVEYRVSQVLQG